MKTPLLLIICFCLSFNLEAQVPKKIYYKYIEQAETYLKAEDYSNANLYYTKAFESFQWRGFMLHRYDAAKVWVKLGQADSAFYYLNRLVRLGNYNDVETITAELAFQPLHQDPRWNTLIEAIRGKARFRLLTGWSRTGADNVNYEAFLDKGVGRTGADVMSIKSINGQYKDFTAIVTQATLVDYIGKRVRLSGYLKTVDATELAAFWIRMDKAGKSVAFANMMEKKKERFLKGTNDWTRCEIVIDVPLNADQMVYGVIFEGKGQVWVDDMKLEVVDASVPLTQ